MIFFELSSDFGYLEISLQTECIYKDLNEKQGHICIGGMAGYKAYLSIPLPFHRGIGEGGWVNALYAKIRSYIVQGTAEFEHASLQILCLPSI